MKKLSGTYQILDDTTYQGANWIGKKHVFPLKVYKMLEIKQYRYKEPFRCIYMTRDNVDEFISNCFHGINHIMAKN